MIHITFQRCLKQQHHIGWSEKIWLYILLSLPNISPLSQLPPNSLATIALSHDLLAVQTS